MGREVQNQDQDQDTKQRSSRKNPVGESGILGAGCQSPRAMQPCQSSHNGNQLGRVEKALSSQSKFIHRKGQDTQQSGFRDDRDVVSSKFPIPELSCRRLAS